MPNRETLVAYLKKYDIRFLAPRSAQIEERLTPDEFIKAIVNSNDSRLMMALMVCFTRHPELATHVLSLTNIIEAKPRLILQYIYTSAVYLQHYWQPTLQIYLPDKAQLPDYFSKTLGLPSPEVGFGKVGLYELSEEWSTISNYNWTADIAKTMDLFLEQLQREATYVTA